MAFVANEQTPEQQANLTAPGGTTSPNPAQSGGSAGAASGGAGVGASPNVGTSTQFGAPASKLGDYLSANAPQIQNQANNVAGALGQTYGQVSNDVANTANQFGQQVASSYTAPDQSLVNNAANNTESFVTNPNNVAAFQAQYNDQYTGPTAYETTNPYANVQSEVGQAAQNAGTFNTLGGLENYFAGQGANATQGTNTLDALLTQGSPQGAATVSNAVNQFNNLTPQLANTVTAQDQNVAQAQAAAQGAQNYAQNAINGQNGTLTNLNNTVTGETAQDIANLQAQNAAVNAGLTGVYSQPVNTTATTLGTYGGGTTPWVNTTNYAVGALSPDVLADLGLTAAQGQQLQAAMQNAGTSQYETGHNFGAGSGTSQIALQQYLQQIDPTQVVTTANAATPEQYAQASALQQLLGGTLPTGTVLNPGQANLAGTAPTSTNAFDFNAALANAQNTATAEQQAAQAEANGLTNSANAAHNASKSHTLGGNFMNNIGTPLATFLANPIAAVPSEVNATKTGLSKVGV